MSVLPLLWGGEPWDPGPGSERLCSCFSPWGWILWLSPLPRRSAGPAPPKVPGEGWSLPTLPLGCPNYHIHYMMNVPAPWGRGGGVAVLDKSQERSLMGHRVIDMSLISEQKVPDTFVIFFCPAGSPNVPLWTFKKFLRASFYG